MSRISRGILSFAAPVSGFALSFIALGLLWVGTPWIVQFLMCVPFFIVALVITRLESDGRLVLLGAAPIALLVAQFRDTEGSHAMPVLLVCAWVASTFLGWYLALRQRRNTAK